MKSKLESTKKSPLERPALLTYTDAHTHVCIRTHTSFTSMRVVPPQRTIEKWVLGPAFPDLHTPAVRKKSVHFNKLHPIHDNITQAPCYHNASSSTVTSLTQCLPLSQAPPNVFHCHKPRPITTLYHALSLAPPPLQHYDILHCNISLQEISSVLLAIPSLSCSSSGTPPNLHHHLPL